MQEQNLLRSGQVLADGSSEMTHRACWGLVTS